jgi:hypothetical protein
LPGFELGIIRWEGFKGPNSETAYLIKFLESLTVDELRTGRLNLLQPGLKTNPFEYGNQKKKIRLFPTFCDFCRLNLQRFQALKDKSNPKQALSKMQLRLFFF